MKTKSHLPKSSLTSLLVAFLLVLSSCQPSANNKHTVIKGEFTQSITESGELEAINSTVVIMPRISRRYGYSYKIVGLAEHGSMVQKGDSVAALDPSNVYKYILNRQESLENARGRAEKAQVQSEINRRDLEVQLKNEEASFDLKKLERERMQFETGLKKKVVDLEYKKAELRLEKVKRKMALYPVLQKYDKQINDLQILQMQADILNAEEVLNHLVLFSPGNGYFQVAYNRRNGQNFKLGDEVNMGAMIAGIPDVSEMKAKSYINETDIRKVKEGMKVIIKLDALPNVSFQGVLTQISSMCTEENGQMIFKTEIEILDKDIRLKPGMSVSCEYISYESEKELFVPNSCLLSENGKVYVFMKKGTKFKKTEVETGLSNATYTIIKTKLKPGRELLSMEEGMEKELE